MTELAELDRFAAELPFALDDFQRRACAALERGHGVLVCAPTGAGKTVVGEFAVHLALTAGGKCFYTTPIKALSNQKHTDLIARYGRDRIGLLTGDMSVNADAPVVVMTTEVLRNMLYADSPALQGLSHVVMDEVHFLADRMRGPVWEEVILHLADEVRLVSLSATVSNAEEFGGWIQTVRGDTTVVVDEHRPVPLWQHVLVGKRLLDLFDYQNEKPAADRHLRVNPELLRHIAHRREADRMSDWTPRRGSGRGRSGRPDRPRFYRPPPRPDVIATLDAEGLLPAITFVFSRAGCDAAVQQCLRSPLRLTSEEERAQIAEVIDHRCGELAEADLGVLGYYEWREGLLRGLAAHHAGMLPAFRHTVEELFTAGLVRAVFATETLALGINMPARTVVLERLVKFNGEQHVPLTPGEYTQLTGRAGPARHRRRGSRRGAVAPRRRDQRAVRGRRAGVHPDLSAAQLVCAVVQHDHQSGAAHGPRAGASAAGAVVRPVSGRPVGGRVGPWHRARHPDARGDRRRTGRRGCADPGIRADARADFRDGEGAVARVSAAPAAGRQARRWRDCAAATSSPSPKAGTAGWPW